MSSTWALALVFIVSYIIGSINIAKIVSWFKHRNIEKEGSGNPGTMNMLRTFGFKFAFITLVFEVVKSGVTALVCSILLKGYGIEYMSFYFSGIALVIGSCFPFFGMVKGGKGVAVAVGVFMFSQLWYVSLALFIIGVVMLIITEYGFLSSLTYILGVSIATTIWVWVVDIPYAWMITAFIWAIAAMIYIKHSKNFQRLINGTENKIKFKQILKKVFHKQKDIEEIDEADVNQKVEKEIVIDEKEIVIDENDKSQE